MVEGFKSLIKISLAVLKHTEVIFRERSSFERILENAEYIPSNNENFIEILKHFSEELRVESH